MNCPVCETKILILKYKVVDCKCGAKLFASMVNGKLEIYNLKNDKGDIKND